MRFEVILSHNFILFAHPSTDLEASSNVIPPPSAASVLTQHRRLPARSVVSSEAGYDSLGALPLISAASKLGRHNLISSLLSGGANLFFNRAAAVDGWHTKRQWAPQTASHSASASVTASPPAYRPPPPPIAPDFSSARGSWPKPLLVIKEYEEYNE